jgi:uncharacterized membrane protein YphA (DoxX/SURF4 family)
MNTIRLIIAMVFLAEVIVGLMHLICIVSKKEFPKEFYLIAPVFMLFVIIFSILITPILNWIIG